MSADVERARDDGMNKRTPSIYDTLSLASDMEGLELIEGTVNHESKRRKTFKSPSIPQTLPEAPCPNPILRTTLSQEESKKMSFLKRKSDQKAEKASKKLNHDSDNSSEFHIPEFNCQYVTDRLVEHVLNCIENQTNPTDPVIPSETLRKWIAEGVNATMDPLIHDIQKHLEEQTTRLEQYYNRKWEESSLNVSHMSYIS